MLFKSHIGNEGTEEVKTKITCLKNHWTQNLKLQYQKQKLKKKETY